MRRNPKLEETSHFHSKAPTSMTSSIGNIFVWTNALVLLLAGGMFSISGFYLLKMRSLKSKFPDLWDDSPEVDGYWPNLAYYESGFLSILCAALGLAACVSFTILIVRRSKRKKRGHARNGTQKTGTGPINGG